MSGKAQRAVLIRALQQIVAYGEGVSFAQGAPLRQTAAFNIGAMTEAARQALIEVGEPVPARSAVVIDEATS